MNTFSKLCLLLSGFCLIVMTGARSVLGAWHPLLYGFLAFFIIGVLIALVLDYKFYWQFISMKTTKNSLSLGWSLLLLISLLGAFSYFSHRFNKTFDLTEEGINSLATQSVDILKTIQHPATISVFFKGDKLSQQTLVAKQQITEVLTLFKQQNSYIKVSYVDTYKNPVLSEKSLSNLQDKNKKDLFVFLNYQGRKIRVEEPFNEEKFSLAFIKARKTAVKEIYLLVGHGERDLNDDGPSGLKAFDQYLKESGFILKQWSFAQQGVPSVQPSLVLIIGPRSPFLPAEISWLTQYLSKKKGHLLVALDPKDNHGLNSFLKNYGVIFNNDFIVSQMGLVYGGYTKALGVLFDKKHPITKRLTNARQILPAFFEKASSLSLTPEASEKLDISYLVKSYEKSFSIPELTNQAAVKNLQALTIGLEVKDKTDKGFRLVIYGDSDFLSNRYLQDGANKDLLLNSVVSLLGQEELITIRPKQPKGTKISLTRYQKAGFIIFVVIWPLLFLMTGLWLWYRKREF